MPPEFTHRMKIQQWGPGIWHLYCQNPNCDMKDFRPTWRRAFSRALIHAYVHADRDWVNGRG